MSDECTSMRRGLEELAAAARHGGGQPAPTPVELFAYLDGDLGAEEEARLQARLALHPGSARALLDLEELARLEVGEPESRPSWTAMEARLEAAAARAEGSPALAAGSRPNAVDAAPKRTSKGVAGLRLALAASLILSLFLGLMVLDLRTTSSPRGPQGNVYHYDLLPEGAGRRRGPGADAVRVPAEVSRFVIVLALADPGVFEEHLLRISDSAGKVVAEVPRLRPSAKGTFSIELTSGWLAAGRYTLLLEGVEADQRKTLAIYHLELEYE